MKVGSSSICYLLLKSQRYRPYMAHECIGVKCAIGYILSGKAEDVPYKPNIARTERCAYPAEVRVFAVSVAHSYIEKKHTEMI